MGNHELDPWVESGEGRVVPGAFCWRAWGGGRAHPGPGCFLLCLQSSGNVWVTHEEMETLATSTKTVSLPLGPGTSDSPEDEVRNVGSLRGWQRPSIPDCGKLCARGHKTLTSLGYRGATPLWARVTSSLFLAQSLEEKEGRMGVSGIVLTPSQAWEPWKHGLAAPICYPHHKHARMCQLSQLTQQAYPGHP